MRDDRDELQMPLMPSRKDHQGGSGSGGGGGGGTKASVVVTVLPTDGPSAYAPTSSLRLIREPVTSSSSSSQPQPQRRPSSTCSSSGAADGRTSVNRKKSSANGGFAIKSPSKSVRSSETGKTSAQVRLRGKPVSGAKTWIAFMCVYIHNIYVYTLYVLPTVGNRVAGG